MRSAYATSRHCRSINAMEKSRDKLRICEWAVRGIASPISSAMAFSRFCSTATVIGSVKTEWRAVC